MPCRPGAAPVSPGFGRDRGDLGRHHARGGRRREGPPAAEADAGSLTPQPNDVRHETLGAARRMAACRGPRYLSDATGLLIPSGEAEKARSVTRVEDRPRSPEPPSEAAAAAAFGHPILDDKGI